MQKESIDPMLLAAQQQLYDYALRLHFSESFASDPYALYAFHQRYDSRFHEQPKPSYSYIGLIAMAILSTPERQLVLSDIYQWILDHYPYFRARGTGWRNSIRHNLSLNDCFVKADRAANGKGHYWSIHPANLADFLSGDFRRRRAQRRVRKSMGLSVPEDEDDEEIEEILPTNQTEHHFEHSLSKFPREDHHSNVIDLSFSSSTNSKRVNCLDNIQHVAISHFEQQSNKTPRKRCFDVDSLLAPDQPCLNKRQKCSLDKNENIHSPNSKSDRSNDTDIFT